MIQLLSNHSEFYAFDIFITYTIDFTIRVKTNVIDVYAMKEAIKM